MRTFVFLMLLLQSLSAQKDSLLQLYLNTSANGVKNKTEDIVLFFEKFFPDPVSVQPAASSMDTSGIYYFDMVFNAPLEYNLSGGSININFNYIIEDKNCNNSNRNGVLLLENIIRTPAKKKEPEKLNKDVYVLIPDKCSTTRFYNSKGEMFCDNKRQYIMEYDEGKKTAQMLRIKVGVQLLPTSKGDYYERKVPAEPNYPVESITKEYVLRCCIRSIVFLKGEEIIDNFVSLK